MRHSIQLLYEIFHVYINASLLILMNRILSLRVIRLRAHSFLVASDCVSNGHDQTTLHGRLERVYFAPRPELWASSRRLMSVDHPV
jgi:hypothetical protein